MPELTGKVARKAYREFIQSKSQVADMAGFAPLWMPDFLFPFQKSLVDWAIRKGRAAIFADCGLGKTAMQLVWAENVVRKTGGRVLILTPLAVAKQTEREATKFQINAKRSIAGEMSSQIVISNYERLDHFNPTDFVGLVCDESSILKSFGGETRKRVTRFMAKMQYRLLCTATAAPNDYIELGTSAEALGELSYSEMLKRFFKYLDDKGQKSEQRNQDEAEDVIKSGGGEYYQKLAYRVAQTIGQWRLKHHAILPFWRWVASWARACRMPSDIGFPDDRFVLPPLIERDHVIKISSPPPGMLFNVPAFGLGAERDERRRTMRERCQFVAKLVEHKKPAIIWCQMNEEGDVLEEIIPGAVQVAGRHSAEWKIAATEWFCGNICRCQMKAEAAIPFDESGRCPVCGSERDTDRKLISKAKIYGFGLNFQFCSNVVTFATHSYEQFYQLVRRCYRFGQKNPVKLDVVCTEGEIRVLANMRRKAKKAELMFDALVREMNGATKISRIDEYTDKAEVPKWLSKNKSRPTRTRSFAEIASM